MSRAGKVHVHVLCECFCYTTLQGGTHGVRQVNARGTCQPTPRPANALVCHASYSRQLSSTHNYVTDIVGAIVQKYAR
jgi:hypothetical protein